MTEESTTDLVVYKDYRTQVKEFKKTNDKLVFDYKSKKGNKDARSHIAKMKKVKAAVEKKRIAAAKEYREQCNDQSDEIQAEIDAMIAVHQKPLDEFAKREETRIAAIKKKINDIFQRHPGTTSEEIQTELDYVNSIDLNDDFWEEFVGEAIKAVSDRLKFLHERMKTRVQWEEDQAELARLRKAEADRKAKEKIERENSDEGFQTQCDIEEDSKTPGVGEIQIDPAKPGEEEIAVGFMDDDGKMHDEDESVETVKISELAQRTAPTLNEVLDAAAPKAILDVPGDDGSGLKLTVKQKREQAEADIVALGFSPQQASTLIRNISFGKVRNIKFEL